MKRVAIMFGSVGLLLLASLSTPAAAQPGPPGPPGQGLVTQNADCSVTVTWQPAIGATSYAIIAMYNGVPVGTFPVGSVTTIRSAPLASGNYLIAIIAINAAGQTQGAPTSFIQSCGGPTPGPPGAPTWVQATATGNTVTLVWVNAAGATGTELQATIQSTGQVITFQLGAGVSTVTFPGVPAGNFVVRLRNFNAFGFGPLSDVRLIVVGVVLGSGDMQVTMTWNTTADIDLHAIDPTGCDTNWHNRNCPSSFLDVDDTDGFGPENIFVQPGQARAGLYQIYIVHYTGVPNTSVTISVTLNPGTAAQQTVVFSRTLAFADTTIGYNVATVDIINRTITEATGTRAAGDQAGDEPVVKQPASAGGSR